MNIRASLLLVSLALLPASLVAQTTAAPVTSHEHAPAPASTALVLEVDGKTTTLSPADLAAMPQRAVTVHNAHTQVDEQYSGVGFADLLAKYGVTLEGAGAKRVYHSYVRAEGTDGYWVLYSASELEDALHSGNAIVALSLGGKPLTADGAFKLIDGADKKPARWVRNLAILRFVTVE